MCFRYPRAPINIAKSKTGYTGSGLMRYASWLVREA